MKKAVKKGRPKVRDGTQSHTVSLRLSEKKLLEKEYGTLTKAIKTLIHKNEELQSN